MKTNKQLEQDLFALAEGLTDNQSQLVLAAIARLRAQSARIAELESQNTDMGWRLNPDRMGGQYTDTKRNEWR